MSVEGYTRDLALTIRQTTQSVTREIIDVMSVMTLNLCLLRLASRSMLEKKENGDSGLLNKTRVPANHKEAPFLYFYVW